ncbi:ferric reductase-like transmembrane domain-containing protein [Thalassococcus sp. S3]|uniref:ferric reductase-like transmembrane domain-containing protein n=1 Tax=Thalassococcus sp. S3 TaxID=2017482 RepID=UPI001024679D|nr:ferric reductase-like transmembrane domain-containing protein [Thalassococcus sp. S3]QBF33031.1 ferric reductase [Thalassococcus sp. S3]
MTANRRGLARSILIWAGLGLIVLVPVGAAAASPLLAWREPVYIIAGFAGVIAMALLLFQPLLAAGYLPGLPPMRGRRLHVWLGISLVIAVVVHVAGLWITSPPDVVDALLFVSPTPFSLWGVIAMWAVFGAALLAGLRRRLRLPLRVWRMGHTALVAIVVMGSVIHAMLVEGTMETLSKALLCGVVLLGTAKVVIDRRAWARRRPAR